MFAAYRPQYCVSLMKSNPEILQLSLRNTDLVISLLCNLVIFCLSRFIFNPINIKTIIHKSLVIKSQSIFASQRSFS